MRNLIRVIVLAFITSVFVVACIDKNKNDRAVQQPIEDSIPLSDSMAYSITEIIKGRIIEDTVIGRWTVKTSIDSNDIIVGKDDWAIKDSSVFITLSYDQKIVYAGKEIRTNDIVGCEGEYFMYRGGNVYWASDSAIYLSFYCALPASDFGWDKLYRVLPDGAYDLITRSYDMGIYGTDGVADFLAMYFSEMSINSSEEDLNRLFKRHCTEDVADELSAGNISIVSDDTDFIYAYRTAEIKELYDPYDSPLQEYPISVKFKPYPKNENITDTLYMVVDSATYKISKIDNVVRIESD